MYLLQVGLFIVCTLYRTTGTYLRTVEGKHRSSSLQALRVTHDDLIR